MWHVSYKKRQVRACVRVCVCVLDDSRRTSRRQKRAVWLQNELQKRSNGGDSFSDVWCNAPTFKHTHRWSAVLCKLWSVESKKIRQVMFGLVVHQTQKKTNHQLESKRVNTTREREKKKRKEEMQNTSQEIRKVDATDEKRTRRRWWSRISALLSATKMFNMLIDEQTVQVMFNTHTYAEREGGMERCGWLCLITVAVVALFKLFSNKLQ